MKTFIHNFISLCLILLGLSIVLEIALLYRTNTYSYKHQYVLAHLHDIHVLLMGNSHIFFSLIPDSMGIGFFNTAISGRPIDYDVELIKQYVPKLIKLNAVVMPLDYDSFCFGRGKKNTYKAQQINNMGGTLKCMYYKYMDVPADFWYWSEILNSKINFVNRFFLTSEEARECDSLGYNGQKLSTRVSGWELRCLPVIIDISDEMDNTKYDRFYNQYKVAANICYDNNVKLILVSTPMYKTYQKRMNMDVVKEMHAFANKLKNEFPNIEYFNFTFDDRFINEDFIDASHLSEKGAIKFSLIMKNVINRTH